ncbi:MAG: hypothetical protein PHG02_06225 [Oscillospiraceae bacterium]|nr:hypothetical protein [Oscillospiraceae bacterium]
MSILVSHSQTPLLPDTLPAVKMTEFFGSAKSGPVYSYLKLHECNGSIHLCLMAFEETPAPQSRLGAAFCFDNTQPGKFIFFSANAMENFSLLLYNNTANPLALPASGSIFSGRDEQGFYWGVETILSADLLAQHFGSAPKVKSVFGGNAFKYNTTEAAFGSAFAVPLGNTVPTCKGFGTFTVVPY